MEAGSLRLYSNGYQRIICRLVSLKQACLCYPTLPSSNSSIRFLDSDAPLFISISAQIMAKGRVRGEGG